MVVGAVVVAGWVEAVDPPLDGVETFDDDDWHAASPAVTASARPAAATILRSRVIPMSFPFQ